METLFPLGGPSKDRKIRQRGTRQAGSLTKRCLRAPPRKGSELSPSRTLGAERRMCVETTAPAAPGLVGNAGDQNHSVRSKSNRTKMLKEKR